MLSKRSHSTHFDPTLDIMRERGMRITAARKRLVQVLANAGRPMAIEALHQLLGPKSFDLVTLYRNLSAFEEIGVLQTLRDEGGRTLYELIDCHHGHHHHVICRKCGLIQCLDECHAHPFEQAAEKLGFQEITHRLELYGLCEACQD
ncbi:MAG: Fur family transcriptional regulator [Verrucomicrobiota bacterium]